MDNRSSSPRAGLFPLFLCAIFMTMSMAKGQPYKDPRIPVEDRVNDLLKRMTLREKIGQMTQIDRKKMTKDIVKEYGIGSVLSGGGSWPRVNATVKDWLEMVNEFQKGALSTRLRIPIIYGIDTVHGHNNVYGATIFPHNIGIGATRDPQLVKEIGAAIALEVRATGIHHAFAPSVAVCRDPRWGRCYESYSENPNIVRAMTELVTGLQGDIPRGKPRGIPYVGRKTKVVACARDYVGDGGTERGINENNTVISVKRLKKIHMPGYIDAIRKGVGSIMVSFASLNGVKMHANQELITTYLKGKLGFKGIVLSNWQGIDKITDPMHANYTYSVEASINAGIDMVMVPYNYTEFISTLTTLVNKNAVPISRINDAVRRILRIKFIAGLFENHFVDPSLADQVGSKKHRELARKAVRKSLVLLKNGENVDDPMIPLPKKTSRILVAGTHADDLGLQCGGWSITWQGNVGNNYTIGTTILQGIKWTVDQTTEVVYKKNPDTKFVKSHDFSYAIVVVGERSYADAMGDNLNLSISEPGPRIIRNVCGNIKCVVVLISGRPLTILPHLGPIKALVAAWLPGTEGAGVADVLFGDYSFTGRSPRTWFKTVDQLPMNIGDPHYDPLYPFGFGITTGPV